MRLRKEYFLLQIRKHKKTQLYFLYFFSISSRSILSFAGYRVLIPRKEQVLRQEHGRVNSRPYERQTDKQTWGIWGKITSNKIKIRKGSCLGIKKFSKLHQALNWEISIGLPGENFQSVGQHPNRWIINCEKYLGRRTRRWTEGQIMPTTTSTTERRRTKMTTSMKAEFSRLHSRAPCNSC